MIKKIDEQKNLKDKKLIKEEINEKIYDVNDNYNNLNEKDKINIIFNDMDNHIKTPLVVSKNTILLNLIKFYYNKKGMPLDNVNQYIFIYNWKEISGDFDKPISSIFGNQNNCEINVLDKLGVVGA